MPSPPRKRTIEPLEGRILLANPVTAQDTGAFASDWEGAVSKGILYFSGASTSAPGTDWELWRSDGTPQGTWRVKDLFPGTYGADPHNFCDVNGTLYFSAIDYTGYRCLWKSDGTDQGTVVVKRFLQVNPQATLGSFTALGDKLFFDGPDPSYAPSDEPWISDGTEAGTYLIRDMAPGSQNTSLGNTFAWNGKVFFTGWSYDSAGKYIGIEPMVSDGTHDGTFVLKDIWPGDKNGYPVYWTPAGGKLFFAAQDPTHGFELWVTDGTSDGTKFVKDILPGSADSNAQPVLEYKGYLYTVANPDNTGQQLWKTNVTTLETTLVKSPIGQIYSPAWDFRIVNDRMIFIGHDATRGDELWVSDGTSAGTHNLLDLRSGTGNGGRNRIREAGGWGLFLGNDGQSGWEIWATDGATTENTFRVADSMPETDDNHVPTDLISAGNKAFFFADLATVGWAHKLWSVTVNAPPPTPPPPPPSETAITGTLFNDLDGDSIRDGSEPRLSGWKLFLDTDKDGVQDAGEPTATTDTSGNYKFTVTPGSYRVREVLQSGWRRTTPSSYHDATVSAGQTDSGNDFGNTQKVLISGNVFNDLDGDGGKDSGEAGTGEWTIFLDADKDGVFDAGERSTFSDSSGYYYFKDLAAGSYRVREVLFSGYRRTTPSSGYYDTTLSSGGSGTGKNFGNTTKGLISGALFNDLDGDGVKDSGETGLAGWRVYLDSDKDGVFDSTERSVLTDSSGNYAFKDLAAGSYRVRQVSPTGWRRTAPGSGYFDITLATAGSSTGKNFGNTQKVLISGTVFNDLDGDKIKDSNEAGLSNWRVFIDSDSDGVWDATEKSVLTSSTGAWSFKDLAAGTYRVRVVQQATWTSTTPTSGYHSITLAAAASSTGKLFGERKV